MSRFLTPVSRFVFSATLVCGVMFSSGCNKKEKEESKEAAVPVLKQDLIAVIDLNVVAQEIGAQAKIDFSVKERESELLSQFNGLKAELGRRVEEIKIANDDLNDQKQNELDSLVAEHSTKLTLQAQAAQSQLLAHHARLKQKLLSEIRPVAYTVAIEKGMQIVLTVGQVYAAGPNVDITQEVVKRIKSMNSTASAKDPSSGLGDSKGRVAVLPDGGEFMPR